MGSYQAVKKDCERWSNNYIIMEMASAKANKQNALN